MKSSKRSPARQALAEAIARHREAEAELARKTTARARTAAAVAAAEQLVADKRNALDIAREGHIDRVEAAHEAGVCTMTAPALSVREARHALSEAEDDLATARGVLERIDRRLAGPQDEASEPSPEETEAATQYVQTPSGLRPRFDLSAHDARRDIGSKPFDWLAETRTQVAEAADAVAREHCDAIITAAVERARKAIAEAQAAGAALAVMARRGIIGEQHAALLKQLPSDVGVPTVMAWRNSVGDFRCEPENVGVAMYPVIVARGAGWDAAMDALQHDADAELPTS